MKLLKMSVVLLAAVLFNSCGETPKNNAETATESKSSASVTYEQKVKKINVITENYNDISTDAFKVYEKYIGDFGDNPKKYISKKSAGYSIDISQYTINKINELDEAIAIPVLNNLNPFMNDFKNSGLAFSKSINEASMYYEMNDYNSDNFEKGKSIHEPIISAFQQFYQADSVLRVHSDKALVEIDKEYMQILKADGLEAQYLSKKGIEQATELMKMLSTIEFEKLEAAKLKELHDPLRATFDELTALKTNDYETYHRNPLIDSFYMSFEETVKASNWLYERVKEDRPFTSMEQRRFSSSEFTASQVTGTPNNVHYRYKDLIDNYNRML